MEQFSYKIIRGPAADGECLIEYRHEQLGIITERVYVPYEQSEEVINKTIVDSVPRAQFVRRRRVLAKIEIPALKLQGRFEAQLEPDWYTTHIQAVDILTPKDADGEEDSQAGKSEPAVAGRDIQNEGWGSKTDRSSGVEPRLASDAGGIVNCYPARDTA